MYRTGTGTRPQEILVTFDFGGLGDMITRLPALEYLLREAPHLSIYLFTYDYFYDFMEIWLKEHFPQGRVFHMKMSIKEQFLRDRPKKAVLPYLDFNPERNTSTKMHLIDHGYLVLNDMVPYDQALRNYPKLSLLGIVNSLRGAQFSQLVRENPDNFYEAFKTPYVVLTTGATCKAREWPVGEINDVIDFLVRNGITPVFLGSKEMPLGNKHEHIGVEFKEGVAYDRGIDLRGSTTLLGALKVMSEASCIVGVDNGLLHLAAMSDVPIIMGLTNTVIEHRVPIRRGVLGWNVETVLPDPDLECQGCQSKWLMPFGANFKFCGYKDYKCVEQMRASKFIGALKRVLNLKGTERQARLEGTPQWKRGRG
jgi:ADP-heptose:LPS heptosyltransferase